MYLEGETPLEWKWYRRVAFILGKTLKYTSWLLIAIFCYHLALIKK